MFYAWNNSKTQEYDIGNLKCRVDSMLQVLEVLPQYALGSNYSYVLKLCESLHQIRIGLLSVFTSDSLSVLIQQLELASVIFQSVVNGEEYIKLRESHHQVNLHQPFYYLTNDKLLDKVYDSELLKESNDLMSLTDYSETLYGSGEEDETFGEDISNHFQRESTSFVTSNFNDLYFSNQLDEEKQNGFLKQKEASKNVVYDVCDNTGQMTCLLKKKHHKRKRSFGNVSIVEDSSKEEGQLKGKGKRQRFKETLLQ